MEMETIKYRQSYRDAQERANLLVDLFHDLITGHVVDVGGGSNYLRNALREEVGYTSVGLYDNTGVESAHQIPADLEEPLPIQDRAYPTVVCSHVMEHIEHVHALCEELFRIADSAVIIGLPNPLSVVLNCLFSGGPKDPGQPLTKYHSLPLAPGLDRHRWFYLPREADAFIHHTAHKCGFKVRRYAAGYPHPLHRVARRTLMRPLVHRSVAMKELETADMWWGLERVQ